MADLRLATKLLIGFLFKCTCMYLVRALTLLGGFSQHKAVELRLTGGF